MSETMVSPHGDLRHAAERFFPGFSAIEAVAGTSEAVRVEAAGEVWIVRRWPEGTAIERIAFVHEALRAAREGEISVVPLPAVAANGGLRDRPTVVALESHWYDAGSWMPGEVTVRRPTVALERGSVDLPGSLPGDLVAQTTAAIARFHAATTGTMEIAGAPRSPLRGFGAAANRAWRRRLQQLDPLSPRVPAVRAWRAAARRAVGEALSRIEAAGTAGEAVDVVAHGNLWPSHVLALPGGEDEVLSGILDWSDAIATSPLVDVAQLITHFGGWTPDRAEAVLGTYHDVRPLRPAERRLLPAVAALDLVVQVGRLLGLGYGDEVRLDQGERSLVRNGAAAMTTSLETLANVLEYGEARPPRQFRKWVYRKPPATRQPKRRGGKGR